MTDGMEPFRIVVFASFIRVHSRLIFAFVAFIRGLFAFGSGLRHFSAGRRRSVTRNYGAPVSRTWQGDQGRGREAAATL